MNFNYYLPVNLLFGRGKAELIGKETAKLGKKVMIVTGRSSAKKSGLLDRAVKQLEAENVEYVLFDKVTANPLTTTAVEGAQLSKQEKCDCVLALGGGSIIDAAKGIAFLSVNDGDINDYIFGRDSSDEALPLVLVPTTCGTGSEGNGFAVLTNPENGDKKSLRCPAIVAKASIIDSELMETMPKSVLNSVGFDALCHCMEAYMSKTVQPIVSLLAGQGMRLSAGHLIKVYEGKGSPEDWDAITWASTIGGMVINTAGVTVSHGMEHPASGFRNIVHGRGLAAITPIVTARTAPHVKAVFDDISRFIGGKNAGDCSERIYEILDAIDLRIGLAEQGVEMSDVDRMVESYFRVSAGNHANHPYQFSKEEIADMYIEAM